VSTTTQQAARIVDPQRAPEHRGLAVRVARWSARHRWWAVLLWVATVTAIVVGAGAAGTVEATNSDEAVGESAAAVKAIDRSEFADEGPALELVLVEATPGATIDQAAGAIDSLSTDLEALPQVARVRDPVISPDGTAALVQAELRMPENPDPSGADAEAASAAVDEVVASAQAANPDVTIEHTGDVALEEAISQIYDEDLKRAELFSVPVTLVILIVVFGALIAASVPLLLALSAVIAAMGLSQLASHLVPTADEVSSVILLVGMAVGVDYSLFYIRREREERLKGRGTYDAIAVAAATSGRAVVISGVTVIIAMAGMFLSGDGTFASLAVGTIAVVAAAVVGSVTVLPALLAILGRWVDRPRVPLLWRLQSRDGNPRFWRAVLRPVLARPAVAFSLGAGLLVALALPALGMKLGDPGFDDLPQGQPAIAAYGRLVELFPDEGANHEVVVWSEDGGQIDRDAVGTALTELDDRLQDDPRFAVENPLHAEYSRAGDVAVVDVPIPDDYSSPGAVESLDALRTDVSATLGSVAGSDAGVTGDTAWSTDFRDQLEQRMPLVVAFVLGLTLIVLVLAFRSLTIALTSVALNLLSVGAAYGLVTLVFQGTWAEGLLGFHSSGAILTWLPLFLFVILFGLSMDYHVFVVSRIREAREAGLDTRAAVAQGITRSAGTVTSAAVVMVAVFSIFATLSALDFKQLGVGLAAAILIDATLVRAVLLPSAMVLLGERNWYLPAWMHRLPMLH
jgi:RND superfamily putative drug exporter